MIKLCPLPYKKTDLEPHISSETLSIHHGKHHGGYVKKLNELVNGRAPLTVEQIIDDAASEGDAKLFNQAAQVWNHGFYWHSLSPKKSKPGTAMSDNIKRDFGSMAELKTQLSEAAIGHFASGWVWLALKNGKLTIEQTHDAETLANSDCNPLLVIDVWEHAYYVDQRNQRAAYVKAVTAHLLNWSFASENYERGTCWRYPS